MTNLAELTEYPKIFGKTYWGNFPVGTAAEEVIKNRNEFVVEEKVKRFAKRPPQSLRRRFDEECFDHIEIYDAGDKYVILNSPYELPETLPPLFELTKPLYNAQAVTLIARVPKRTRRQRPEVH